MTTIRIDKWDIDLVAGTATSDDVLVHLGRKLGGERFITDIIGWDVTPADAILIGREVLEAFEAAQSSEAADRG